MGSLQDTALPSGHPTGNDDLNSQIADTVEHDPMPSDEAPRSSPTKNSTAHLLSMLNSLNDNLLRLLIRHVDHPIVANPYAIGSAVCAGFSGDWPGPPYKAPFVSSPA